MGNQRKGAGISDPHPIHPSHTDRRSAITNKSTEIFP